MADNPCPKPKASDAWVLDRNHEVIEEMSDCGICGEPFEVGQRAINVPFDGRSRLVTTVHLGCAVNGDEVEL